LNITKGSDVLVQFVVLVNIKSEHLINKILKKFLIHCLFPHFQKHYIIKGKNSQGLILIIIIREIKGLGRVEGYDKIANVSGVA
jgi:hypothetical protein